jgi:L-alanine-DL-glutamate epimerase-like enolase superfamily enzyme
VLTIQYWQKDLAFAFPFTISKGTKTHQSTFVVELEWRGLKGYGEAPAISYYNITTQQMADDLAKYRTAIEKFSLTDPKRFWHFLHHLIPGNPFLVCALDMAAWDLFGKMRKQSLSKLLQLDTSHLPFTDYTIGIDSKEMMLHKVRQHQAPTYKIKVGGMHDLEIIEAVRNESNAAIRVDANAGWTYQQAKEMLPALSSLGVELIEQPLPVNHWSEMKELKSFSTIPLLADESCVNGKDIDPCAESFHGINIKLTKCSGITPALDMITAARKKGLKIMLGCMNESSIGTAAMIHLSPLVDYLDADGPLLLKEDLATGLVLENHAWEIPVGPGLGIQINNDL